MADIVLFNPVKQMSRCGLAANKVWPKAIGSFIQQILFALVLKMFPSGYCEEALRSAAGIGRTTCDT